MPAFWVFVIDEFWSLYYLYLLRFVYAYLLIDVSEPMSGHSVVPPSDTMLSGKSLLVLGRKFHLWLALDTILKPRPFPPL